MQINVYKDILFLVALFILPSLVFIHPIIGKFDEVIFIYMIMAIVTRMLLRQRDILFPFLISSYLFYSLFLIFYNGIPVTHILQIIITSKFLIIFLYFYTNGNEYKQLFFQLLMQFIMFVFMASLVMTVLQFTLPAYFCGYVPDGRGINGVCAGGVFCSRILYSPFLIIFTIIMMSIRINVHNVFKTILRYRYWLLILTLFLLVLTFSRKEMVIGFLILVYLFRDKIYGYDKIIFYFLLFLFIVGFIAIFAMAFSSVNDSTFTEKQIRYLMLLHSLDIFSSYFPFGSGPGTYGSIMSLDYTAVYEEFNVATSIYLGHDGDARGPIFDLFLVGLLAEYGLGVFFFLWFLRKMASAPFPLVLDELINVRKVKVSLIAVTFIVAFFVPIFLNWIGFLIFTILGTLSSKEYE
jgi:hypothetical protein